jgi:ketosteroid isomerase-like protein
VAEELISTVRRFYDAMSRWDVESLSHSVSHDFELNLPDTVPFGGTHHGYDGVEATATVFRDYIEGPWAEPDDFLNAGDALVVLGRLRGTAKRTRQEFEVPFAHVWTFDEVAPSRCRAYYDTAPVTAAIEPTGAPGD